MSPTTPRVVRHAHSGDGWFVQVEADDWIVRAWDHLEVLVSR